MNTEGIKDKAKKYIYFELVCENSLYWTKEQKSTHRGLWRHKAKNILTVFWIRMIAAAL